MNGLYERKICITFRHVILAVLHCFLVELLTWSPLLSLFPFSLATHQIQSDFCTHVLSHCLSHWFVAVCSVTTASITHGNVPKKGHFTHQKKFSVMQFFVM